MAYWICGATYAGLPTQAQGVGYAIGRIGASAKRRKGKETALGGVCA